jgi:hypothetical protein
MIRAQGVIPRLLVSLPYTRVMIYVFGCVIIFAGLVFNSPFTLVVGTAITVYGIASGEHGE